MRVRHLAMIAALMGCRPRTPAPAPAPQLVGYFEPEGDGWRKLGIESLDLRADGSFLYYNGIVCGTSPCPDKVKGTWRSTDFANVSRGTLWLDEPGGRSVEYEADVVGERLTLSTGLFRSAGFKRGKH